MLRTMIDWSTITPEQWATLTDTELAAQLGCTAANVGSARKRHSASASPAGHGGVRDNAGRRLEGDDDEPTTATINMTKGEKRRLMQAHKRDGKPWNQWALEALLKRAGL